MIKDIILQLYDLGAIKFGSFTLKSGIISPIYIDIRESISFPPLLKAIADAMWQKVERKQFDRICGVPYTALPMASYLSIAHNKPMIMRRKESKEHGTKKMIEGVFSVDHVCLILEDLITSGASIFETIMPIEEVGMKVHDVVVFLDRMQGGRKRVESKGYQLHSVVTLNEVLDILEQNQRVNKDTKEAILDFAKRNTHA